MYVKKYLCHLRVFEIMFTVIFFRGMCIFSYVMFYHKIETNKSGTSNKIVELMDTLDNQKYVDSIFPSSY